MYGTIILFSHIWYFELAQLHIYQTKREAPNLGIIWSYLVLFFVALFMNNKSGLSALTYTLYVVWNLEKLIALQKFNYWIVYSNFEKGFTVIVIRWSKLYVHVWFQPITFLPYFVSFSFFLSQRCTNIEVDKHTVIMLLKRW